MDICFTGDLTLHEALEIAYADDDENDSGDEIEVIPDHFTGRQLLAKPEIVTRSNNIEQAPAEDNVNLLKCSGNAPKQPDIPNQECEIPNTKTMQWVRGDIIGSHKVFPSSNYNFYKVKSANELFELSFDDAVFSLLSEQSYSVTGTFRDNRLPKNCPLKSNHELKSATRGTQDAYIAKDYVIMFVRWVDNNVVTIGSTAYGVSPSTSVKRYSQAEKRVIQVPRPCLLGQYYKYIGGTDQMDQNVDRYRISIRGKKWWWCIFTWLVDASINNA
ncbi:hypothetical protein ILUMI_15112 [Ignelater luminosus]|uniref:PiggyBac transposable element-derived protein domain-containing protein n=1 Tax=Ignelater luminosus TaxID=2038154 RepID=A0A8K0G9U8_IGNLU|nr:hypothetical protein ILUMI_15112 [Ignelater luminosus]